jgi:N6-adenosine-specific RNA methylase IME4
MTKKQYEIIYTDPPWQYDSSDNLAKTSLLNKDENFHYPTMPLEKIKEIDVPSLCADNCLMFMWVVNPMLDDGIDLLKHWGFNFATVGFVWHKEKTNPGYYTMSSVEMVIIGKKGKIPEPRGARNVKQFLSQTRGKHSAKPQEIRHRIEQMFPTQKKLEMFARYASEGWDVWGNEFDVDENGLEVVNRNTFEGKEDFIG